MSNHLGAGLDVKPRPGGDDLEEIKEAFETLTSEDATPLAKADAALGGILGALQLPFTLANDHFALATEGLADLVPPQDAATLGTFHLGIPHMHTHPPAMPIPLPSFGAVGVSGCASVLINGKPAARAGDVGMAPTCGSLSPLFEVVTGSSKVFIGGARAARRFDITRHCAPPIPGLNVLGKLGSAIGAVQMVAGVAGIVSGGVHAAADEERAGTAEEKAARAREDARQKSGAEAAEAEAEAEAYEDEAAAAREAAGVGALQTGLDAAGMVGGMLVGLDPGTPPCVGALVEGCSNVLIGGFPMVPFETLLGLFTGGKKSKKKPKKVKAGGREPPRRGNNLKCDGKGEPVDPVTGANFDEWVDHEAEGVVPFRWGRSYSSADAGRDGPMGRGFRHTYERSLSVDLDRAIYTDAEGRPTEIPLPAGEDEETTRGGYSLRVSAEESEVIYAVAREGEPAVEFVRERRPGAKPRLRRLLAAGWEARFFHDPHGRLTGMLETSASGQIETRLSLDERGHILEVRRGPRGERDLPLVAAYGYDHRACLVVSQDALGHTTRYAYDAAGRMVRKTDPSGYSFDYAYDELGRCVESRGSDGRFRVTLRYDREARRTFVTEVDGGEWIIDYDEDGTITRALDPYGGERRRVLDGEGRVVREVGPGAHELRFLYDGAGRHHGIEDRFGYRHATLDEEPNPEDPLALRVPGTAWEQQWGDALGPPSGPEEAAPDPRRERDALGRVIEEVDAAGHRQAWAYDAAGNAVRCVDRDGREHRTRFSSWRQVSAEIDPLGHCTEYDYTMRSEIARVVDPGGSVSRYEYDLKDRLVRVVRHGVVHDEYSYDEGDCLIEKRDGAGNVLLRRTHGENGLPAERRLASGEVYRYEHNERGQVTRAYTEEVDVRRGFDRRGRLIRDERDGRGVRHRFEGDDLRETTYFGRFTVAYEATADGSLAIRAPVGGASVRRGRDGSVVTELGNGTTATSLYDHDGRCRGRELRRVREGKVALWYARYSWSAEGDLLRVEDNARGVTEYRYDAAHRLIGEKRPDGALVPIVLDAAGNVLEKEGLAGVELLEGNRLRAAGGERFRYGHRNHVEERRAEGGETVRYRYDSSDMLVEVSWSGREEAWRAGYDGLRRRVYKALGEARTDYFWDEHRLAAEVGPTGALRLYVYAGPDALVPLMFIDYEGVDADPASGGAYYPIGDQLGVPLHIEDQRGRVVWRAERVEPYGEVSVHPGASIAYAPRFPGHHRDEETGLHYNRFRYYSPRLGRYLQSDPIGQSGGINLYGYPANPLGDVDVLGLVRSCRRNNNRPSDAQGQGDQQRPGPSRRGGAGGRPAAREGGDIIDLSGAEQVKPGPPPTYMHQGRFYRVYSGNDAEAKARSVEQQWRDAEARGGLPVPKYGVARVTHDGRNKWAFYSHEIKGTHFQSAKDGGNQPLFRWVDGQYELHVLRKAKRIFEWAMHNVGDAQGRVTEGLGINFKFYDINTRGTSPGLGAVITRIDERIRDLTPPAWGGSGQVFS